MRADRLLAMLLTLQTRGKLTARELARRLEVSERTIYRDIDALSAAGVPIYAERGHGGGVALLEGYQTRLTGLTEAEVQALSVFGASGTLSDLGLGGALESALLKLSAALPGVHRHSMERVRERVHLDTARWFAPKEEVPHLQTLQEAVWQDRELELLYRKNSGEEGRRLVEPHGLVAKAGTWYLMARTGRGWRVYRVSRVREARLTGESFERAPDFDLARAWQDWCRSFESGMARYEVLLLAAPAGQDLLPAALGSWVRSVLQGAPAEASGCKRLHLSFEDEDQALGLLIGLGSTVEVLAPETLRRRLGELAADLSDLYRPAAYRA